MAINITENWTFAYTHKNYTVNFFTDEIYTTVTANPAVVSDWIDNIKYINGAENFIVGLDTEWRPTFSTQYSPVATLQLCVKDRCLIYQILHSYQIPDSLNHFLSPEFNFIVFVGVGIKADLDRLQRDYGIGGRAHYEELGSYAADVYELTELKSKGLANLAKFVLEKEVEKPREVRLSRWDHRYLTPAQVQYACVDAYLSCEIGRALGLGIFNHKNKNIINF